MLLCLSVPFTGSAILTASAGVILGLALRLRPTTHWTRQIQVQRMQSLELSHVLSITEEGTFLTIDWGEDEVAISSLKLLKTTQSATSEASAVNMARLTLVGGLRYLRTLKQLSLQATLPTTDYYSASSWMCDRTGFGPELSATSMILTEQTDVTLFVELQHLDIVAEVIVQIVSEHSSVEYVGDDRNSFAVRYVPKGGGVFAANCACDMIAVDSIGSGTKAPMTATEIASTVMNRLFSRGVNVYLHFGKTFPGYHPCFHKVLPLQTRGAINALLEKYNQNDFFDCGQIELKQYFEL